MMKFDDFEDRLAQVPRRLPPAEWRQRVLSDAAAAAATAGRRGPSDRGSAHEPIRPGWPWKLNWNWNWAWSALAAAWVAILSLHSLTPGESSGSGQESLAVRLNARSLDGDGTSGESSLDQAVLREQRQLLQQLLNETAIRPVAAQAKPVRPVRLKPSGERPSPGWGCREGSHDVIDETA